MGNIMTSMWTGVSGLKTNQSSLNTVSHNLANINTEIEFLKNKKEILEQINDAQAKTMQADDKALLDEYQKKLRHYENLRRSDKTITLVDVDGNGLAYDNINDVID